MTDTPDEPVDGTDADVESLEAHREVRRLAAEPAPPAPQPETGPRARVLSFPTLIPELVDGDGDGDVDGDGDAIRQALVDIEAFSEDAPAPEVLTPAEMASKKERERLERLAARYSRGTLTHYLPLSSTWAWQRTLVEDAEQSTKFGPVLRMLEVIQKHESRLHEWPILCKEIFSILYADISSATLGAVVDTPDASGASPVRSPSALALGTLTWLRQHPQWDELAKVCRRKRAIAMTSAASICNALAHEIWDLPSLDAPLPEKRLKQAELGHKLTHDERVAHDQALAKARSPEEIMAEAARLLSAGVHESSVGKLLDPVLDASTARRSLLLEKLGMSAAELASDAVDGTAAEKSAAAAQAASSLFAALVVQILQQATSLSEMHALLSMCGLGPTLADPNNDPVSLELLKQLRALPQLKSLIHWVGRIQREARGKMAPSKIRIRPDGVQKSQHDLLASEWVLESVDSDLWTQRYLDKETVGLLRVGEEPEATGDLVIVVDDSGSMGHGPGSRSEWARGLAAALVLEAMAQRRRCVVAIYSSILYGMNQYADVEVLSPADLPKMFELLAVVYGQGTDTRLALLRAAKKLKAPLREPDMLLITDGAWEKLREEDFDELKGPSGDGRLFVLLLQPYGDDAEDVAGAAATWVIPELDIETTKRVLSTLRSKGPVSNTDDSSAKAKAKPSMAWPSTTWRGR